MTVVPDFPDLDLAQASLPSLFQHLALPANERDLRDIHGL